MSSSNEGTLGGLLVFAALVVVGVLIFGISSCDKNAKPATGDSPPQVAKEKVIGTWKNDKHTVEFTTGAHAVIDGKFTYYEFYSHGLSNTIYLHLGRKKTNEYSFECSEDDLILVYRRQCGWQTDIDNDDKLSEYEGRYQRVGKASTKVASSDDKLTKLKSKLEGCEKQHKKLQNVLAKMDADKTAIVQQLKGLGVKSQSDIKGNHQAQVLSQELLELSKEREGVRKSYDDISLKVTQIGSMLRRIERQASIEGSAVSEKELDEMLIDLGDKLEPESSKPVQSLEMEEVLEKELSK